MNTITINNHILLVPTNKGIEVIDINTIIRIEADSNYSRLFFTNGKTLLVAKVLRYFDEVLIKNNFIRIHKTHLINSHFITRFSNNKVYLQNEEYKPVSKGKKSFFLKQMYAGAA